MRCLALANAATQLGVQSVFLSRHLPDAYQGLLREGAHAYLEVFESQSTADDVHPALEQTGHAHWLPVSQAVDANSSTNALRKVLHEQFGLQQVDVLVVDHYALNAPWELSMKEYAKKLLVIDDLADRPHQCDVLIDQNLGRSVQDYASLVPPDCQVLAGPAYALLRPEFKLTREGSLQRRSDSTKNSVLIGLGGVDADNVSETVLRALINLDLADLQKITVVMGAQAPHRARIEAFAANSPLPIDVLVNTNRIAQLLASHDWAIGAAGSSAWERCCLGVPTITSILAANQLPGGNALARSMVSVVLPYQFEQGGETEVARTLSEAVDSLFSDFHGFIHRSSKLCDGMGCDRVVSILFP